MPGLSSVPDYGARALVNGFLAVRFFTVLSMLAVCGILAVTVATLQSGSEPYTAPRELTITLGVVVFGTLYSLISVAFVFARADTGLLVMGAADCLLTICFGVFSILLGRTLSYENCTAIGNINAASRSTTAYTFVNDTSTNFGKNGDTLSIGAWAGSSASHCMEAKAIWGLCISLALLFSCSGLMLPSMWYKSRKAGQRRDGKGANV